MIVVRTSFRGAPRRIIFNASNTAPLGRVCAGDGDVGSACRLGNPLAFAIYQRPVSRDASSIAQTDVQHFADQEVMRNSRASLAEVCEIVATISCSTMRGRDCRLRWPLRRTDLIPIALV